MKLNAQGQKIEAAIIAGIAAMTADRWAEEEAKAAQFEDEGEWFAPEFAAAREATAIIKGGWDFSGWENELDYLQSGGKIGGVSFRVDAEVL